MSAEHRPPDRPRELTPRTATPDDHPGAATLLAQANLRGWSASTLADRQGASDWRVRVVGPVGAPVAVAITSSVLDEAELHAVVVDPSARRAGIGRALLTDVLARLKADGIDHVHLEVRSDNRPARSLYGLLGFREVGRRPRFYGDDDAVLMTWSALGPSSIGQ